MEPAQIKELESLVQYQENSVVSQTVIDKEVGTITLFAFDKDEGLSEHTTPYDALVYIIDGKAEITIDGTPYNVKKGETIIMPANEPHALKAIERYKMMLVMIKSK